MANKNRTGYYPVGTLNGSPWFGGVRRFVANTVAANVCVGDLVSLDALGKAQVTAAGGTNILGAVVGIEPVTRTTSSVQASSLTLERVYLPSAASGTTYVRVACDPFTIFETVLGNTTTPLFANSIGENFDILTTAGGQQSPSTTPLGPAVLDGGNPLGNVSGQVIVMAIPEYPDNEAGANQRIHVIINESFWKAGKATASQN